MIASAWHRTVFAVLCGACHCMVDGDLAREPVAVARRGRSSINIAMPAMPLREHRP